MVMLYDSTTRPTNQSGIAAPLASGQTIPTAGLGITRCSPGAAATAVVLQAGTALGQQIIVTNEAVAANTITMDVVANSNVADGVTTVIPGLRASQFIWAGLTSSLVSNGLMPTLYDDSLRPTTVAPSAAVLVNGSLIPTIGLGVSRVNPAAAAVTGAIMEPGKIIGQVVMIVNESPTYSVTFDIANTSNVADGVTSVIPPSRVATFIWAWSGNRQRWFHSS